MSLRGVFLSLLFVTLGVLLIIYSKVITNWYFNKTHELVPIDAIARAVAINSGGTFKSPATKPKKKANAEFENIKKSEFDVYHGDEFRIPKEQTIRLTVAGYNLAFYGPAQWNVEKWDPSLKNSPIYITVVDGLIKMDQQGQTGQVYIVRDGRIYPPEMQPEEVEPRKIVVSDKAENNAEETKNDDESLSVSNVNLEVDEIDESTPTEETATAQPKAENKVGKMPDKRSSEQVLSNVEISTILNEKSHLFRRCQINSLRENKNSEGRVLIQMTVQPNGKTTQVKVLQNNTQNKELAECVLAVIQRIGFREFVGLPVTVSYPIEFQ
jgi:TonB family protein